MNTQTHTHNEWAPFWKWYFLSSDVHVYLQQRAAGVDRHMLAVYHTGEVVDSVVAGIPAVHSPGKLAGTPLVDCIPVEVGHHLGVAAVHIVHLVGYFLKLPDFNLTLIYYKFEPRSWRGVFDTTLCDKVYQWHTTVRWFSLGIPVSPTSKTDRNNITEILLKVALTTINQPNQPNMLLKGI